MNELIKDEKGVVKSGTRDCGEVVINNGTRGDGGLASTLRFDKRASTCVL
jgi:hypothetical protein